MVPVSGIDADDVDAVGEVVAGGDQRRAQDLGRRRQHVGILPDLGDDRLPVVHPQAGAEGEDAEVRIGDQDPLPQVVAKAVHDAEHHDERHDADRHATDRDRGVERELPRVTPAPQIPQRNPPLQPARPPEKTQQALPPCDRQGVL